MSSQEQTIQTGITAPPPIRKGRSKQCGKCHGFKPLKAFDLSRKSKDGRQGYCTVCAKTYRATHGPRIANKGTSLRARLGVLLRNINGRCSLPSTKKFEYYGGRGIKNYLTVADLTRLWARDDADKMVQPSIDRENSHGHYTFDNCRFIEFADNRATANHKQSCQQCGVEQLGIRRGLCSSCTPVPRCKLCCEPTNKPRRNQRYCDRCQFVERPCAWCGKPVRRDINMGSGYLRNKQWFCNKQEQGKWLGTNHGGGRANSH